MANKLIQDLTAGAFALTDLLEHQPIAGPPSLKGDVAALVTLLNTIYAPITGGAYVLKAGDTMTGLLTIAQATANTSNLILSGYSLTGANAQSLFDVTGTLNTSGVPGIIKANITNTASGAGTRYIDLQIGGQSQFIVGLGLNGSVLCGVPSRTSPFIDTYINSGCVATGVNGLWVTNSTAVIEQLAIGGLTLSFNDTVSWYSASNVFVGSPDLLIRRDAANVLAQSNGTAAQAFRWYRTFTNSTNYERGALQTAAGQIILAAETAGTGTDDLDLVLTPAGTGQVTLPGGAQLLKTTAAMTSGGAAALGTLTNAPTAGNPPVWCPIMFNGVQHWFPCWA